ncbi:hypothetical protein WMY93_006259 [Mugilogobius chulae]|uniref:DDE Tnp4 domain-containing protein n=1 Tax=Mugilogobius chulae TaxID=88201 RepID=A0AAW0PMH8_9GOBI
MITGSLDRSAADRCSTCTGSVQRGAPTRLAQGAEPGETTEASYVCSYHFVDGKPTPAHPFPEKWLGYGSTASPLKSYGARRRKQTTRSYGGTHVDRIQHQNHPIPNDDTCSIRYCLLCLKEEEEELETSPPVAPDHAYATSASLPRPLVMCDQSTQVSEPPELYKRLLRSPNDADELRLNLLQDDLAERFRVSQSQVSKITSAWYDIMEEKMRCHIPWLPRETIQATLPKCFKEHYPTATCVIDCCDAPLQKPYTFGLRGLHTIRYLVALAPSGMIMFVSAAYGGKNSEKHITKNSDKYITINSGILDLLRPEDVVMVDKGFLISDSSLNRACR